LIIYATGRSYSLDPLANTVSPGDKPEIWPIVQGHNTPVEVSPEEFREAMLQGMSSPAGGIMMFSDRSLLDDPRKLEVMRELYLIDSLSFSN